MQYHTSFFAELASFYIPMQFILYKLYAQCKIKQKLYPNCRNMWNVQQLQMKSFILAWVCSYHLQGKWALPCLSLNALLPSSTNIVIAKCLSSPMQWSWDCNSGSTGWCAILVLSTCPDLQLVALDLPHRKPIRCVTVKLLKTWMLDTRGTERYMHNVFVCQSEGLNSVLDSSISSAGGATPGGNGISVHTINNKIFYQTQRQPCFSQSFLKE